MSRQKKRYFSVFLGTVVAVSTLGPSVAQAAPPTDEPTVAIQSGLSVEDTHELRSVLAGYGIDSATQDRLIAKFNAGQMWDSMRPDAVAVSTEVITRGAEVTKISRYADGSFAARSAPAVPSGPAGIGGPGTVVPQTVSECQFTSAAPYAYYWSNWAASLELV